MKLWENIIQKLQKYVEQIIFTFKNNFIVICLNNCFSIVLKWIMYINLNNSYKVQLNLVALFVTKVC